MTCVRREVNQIICFLFALVGRCRAGMCGRGEGKEKKKSLETAHQLVWPGILMPQAHPLCIIMIHIAASAYYGYLCLFSFFMVQGI